MRTKDWFDLMKLAFITFYHVVIRGHEMSLSESYSHSVLNCNCGYMKVIE